MEGNDRREMLQLFNTVNNSLDKVEDQLKTVIETVNAAVRPVDSENTVCLVYRVCVCVCVSMYVLAFLFPVVRRRWVLRICIHAEHVASFLLPAPAHCASGCCIPSGLFAFTTSTYSCLCACECMRIAFFRARVLVRDCELVCTDTYARRVHAHTPDYCRLRRLWRS